MRNSKLKTGAGVVLALSLCACAAKRPILYPKDTYQQMGLQQAQWDIDQCLQMAQSGGPYSSGAGDAAERTVVGAAGGAATGAIGGAIAGNVGSGAAIGAATGAAAGLISAALSSTDPDPIFRRFVEQCLRDRGYHPIGWR